MQAYWATGPLAGEIREGSLPPPASGELRIKALVSGISRGTETLVAKGEVPPSQWRRMRGPFQEGDFPFPVKYGYSMVGLVEAGRADMIGRRVFALHPHQTSFNLPAHFVHRLPETLPSRRAVLAANLETALNGLWDATILPGDRVIVIGAGTVGLLAAWLAARVPGSDVTVVDVDGGKADLARSLGCAFAMPDWTFNNADLVIEASGHGQALAGAFRRAAFEGTILALGWYGSGNPALPLGEDFHSKRLRLVSSQVGHVAPPQRARWSHARRLSKVLELLAGDARLDGLLTGETAFAGLPGAMPSILSPDSRELCHLVSYQDEQVI